MAGSTAAGKVPSVRVGDKVRLIGVPRDLEDAATKEIYERCLGHDFIVAALNENGDAELQIEAITGTSGDKIYVPPRFLRVLRK